MALLDRLIPRPQRRRAGQLAQAPGRTGFEIAGVEDLGDTLAFRRDPAASLMTIFFASIALFLVAALWIGSFAKQETMRGQVTASSGAVRMTATVGGIVSDVWVRQGDLVKAGQKLVTIRPQQSSAGGGSLVEADIAALEAQRRNLVAERDRIETLHTRDDGDRLRFETDNDRLLDTLARQETRLIQAARDQEAIVEKFRRHLKLGYATREALLSQERAHLDYIRQIADTRIQMTQLSTTVTERQRGLERASTEAENARSTLTSRIEEIGAQLERARAEIATDILAPSDGQVAALNVTPGVIADAGQVVAALADPGAEPLIVLEAPSRTIGLVEPGQRVVLKYDAFPYKTFGVQYGEVLRIGEAPLALPKTLDPGVTADPRRPAQSTFLVEVRPERKTISAYGEERPIVIGSTLSADVVVERRRLIDWVLEPDSRDAGAPVILPFLRQNTARVRTLLQSEASECGLTCLAMIANAHGHTVDLGYMRALHPVSRKGTTLADLYNLAPVFGLEARGLGIQSIEELAALKLPAILHWEGVHFVVLESIRNGRYTVHDPAVGRRVFEAADMARSFSGIALEIEPRMAIETIVSERGGLKLWDIVKGFDGFRPALVKILVVSLAVGLLTLATPILLQVALDFVLPQADVDLLGVLALGLCALLVFDALGRWLRDMIILRSSIGMQLQFSRSLIGHGFRLPLHYFESRHPGDFVTRMESIENVKSFAVNGLVRSLADAVMSVLAVAMMAYYSPSLTLIVLATLCVALATRFAFFERARRFTTESLIAKGEEAAVLLDGLSQVAALKAHNATTAYSGRWYEALSRFAGRDFLAHKVQIEAQALVHIIVVIGTVATLYLGVAGVILNELTIGMLYAFFALRTSFFETADTLTTNLMQLSIVGAHVRRLEDMIGEEPESAAKSGTILRAIRKSVEIEDVTIRFGAAERPVVSKASFSIDVAGEERIAIIGESGSGKSSLLKVIASLAQPTEGAIRVDGHSLARFGLLEYRANIGAVFAGDGLIRGTVAENVTLFHHAIGPDRIFQALETVGLADEIDALPQGLATPLSEESALLSTGQRRRLLAARAICREPRLMLFDEITANLDGDTEETLLTNLNRLPGAKIFVTHSDRLLAHVDRAFRLKDGQLTEFDPQRLTGRLPSPLPRKA